MLRAAAFLAILGLATLAARAETRVYTLDPDASVVQFDWHFGKDVIHGKMPIAVADLAIDFQDLRRSRVHVELDAADAQAGFAFATQAMRGPKVLDTRNHPRIVFDSAGFVRDGDRATIEGMVTIRGVTRPMSLSAELYRPQGTDPADLGALIVHLQGRVMRSEFGATGWSDMAGDEIGLSIRAHVLRTD